VSHGLRQACVARAGTLKRVAMVRESVRAMRTSLAMKSESRQFVYVFHPIGDGHGLRGEIHRSFCA